MASQKARPRSSRAKGAARGATATQAGGRGTRADTGVTRAAAGASARGGTRQAGDGKGGPAEVQRGRGQRGQGQRDQARPAAVRSRPGELAPPSALPGTRRSPSAWFQWTTLILSLGGLGVSIYLTVVHYTSLSNLACSASGAINCEKVITSPESMVFGVFPVAVLGLAFYVFMVAISTPWAWRSRLPAIGWARLGGVVTGMGFVLYLLYAEIVQIGNICLWCTSVHVITFLLFVLLVFQATFGAGAIAKDAR